MTSFRFLSLRKLWVEIDRHRLDAEIHIILIAAPAKQRQH